MIPWPKGESLRTRKLFKQHETRRRYRKYTVDRLLGWESLSIFVNAPIFRIALLAVATTPFLASLYVGIKNVLPDFVLLNFPIQMALLFFSGVTLLSAKIIFTVALPLPTRERINVAAKNKSSTLNEDDLHAELELILFHDIQKLPIDGNYLKARKNHEAYDAAADATHNQNKPTIDSILHSDPILGWQELRSGFRQGSIIEIQNLLFDIANSTGRKLWRSDFPRMQTPHHIQMRIIRIHTPYVSVNSIQLELVSQSKNGMSEGDLHILVSENTERTSYIGGQGKIFDDYFDGLRLIWKLGANDLVLSFIEEKANSSKFVCRIIVAFLLSTTLFLISWFFIIQFESVIEALYT